MAAGDNSTLYVLYGSATGNAEGISKDLTDELNNNKSTRLPAPFKKAVCWELNQFKKCLKEWAIAPKTEGQKYGALLVSSTTGNGDPPENASRFTRFVKKQNKDKSQPKPFEHVAYSVLALGDTNYDQFCATGMMIDRMVSSLGGTRALPIVCADEGTGMLEETIDPWMANVAQDVARACLSPLVSKSASATTSSEEEKVDTSSSTDEAAASAAPTTVPEASSPAAVVEPATESESESPPSDAAVTPPPETSPYPLYILYASATGNAEAIAKDLAATYEMILANPDSKTYFSEVVCTDLNKFKKLKLVEDVWCNPPCPGNDSVKHGLLVVASTTGNGDAPENSDKFLRYLKKSSRTASKDPLVRPFQHVAFAVLGLGDTNYDQYCEHAKLLNKHMLALGGTAIRPLTCADEGTGQLEEVVDAWTGSVLMEVTDACRGAAATSKPTTKSPPAASIVKKEKKVVQHQEEEKKDESFEDFYPSSSESTSPGVLMVQSLFSSKNQGIPVVELSTLPKSALSHLASVEFVSESGKIAAEKVVVIDTDDDETSEDGVRYTLEQPFESSIVSARYLTATSCDAADEICEGSSEAAAVEAARDVLDRRFPLQIENDVQEAAASRNGKRVLELTLSLPDDGSWEYQPGDSLGLIVSNTPEAVGFILTMLQSNHGISPTQKVSIDSGIPVTVEEIVMEKIDLCTFVKNRKIFVALSQLCSDPHEKAVLELLSSKTDQGSELLETFVTAQRRSIVDLFREFPSCQSITLQNLVSLLPPIPPRYYSVSSSPIGSNKGNSLTVAFSVVDYLTPSLLAASDTSELGLRRIHGVATSHLEALCAPMMTSSSSQKNPSICGAKIFPKPSEEFHLPADSSIPLVLIGPGTGIAPFLGFLDHRKALKASADPVADAESTTGSVEVFFGCRHVDHDYLYREELQALKEDGTIDHLHTAFSRDGAKKEYVQDLMTGNAETSNRLADTLLNQNGRVYVCGDGNHMGRDVQATIAKLLGPSLVSSDKGAASADEVGKEYFEGMKRDGRFLLDIWS
jgi:sulfite reductase alpha subunit-like flavoprotein